MACMTLPHAKSIITSHCTPSVIARYERQSIADFYTDRQLSVISTYVLGEVQTPLGQSVVDI